MTAANKALPPYRADEAPVAVNPERLSRNQRYTLGLLLLIYICGFVDRQIVNVLAETLKVELGLRNWQLGLLTGFAFSIFYSTLGVPLAVLADRGYRKTIITVSAGVWSGFTMLCGAAQSFTFLFAARVGVGIGEAGGTPASHAILTSIMPPSRRAMALSIYAMGVPIGTLIGMVLGGLTADIWGWRWAFVVAGLPGILLCAVSALTLREPPRPAAAQARRTGMIAAFREILATPAVRSAVLGGAMISLVFFGQSAFAASFLQRVHGAELASWGAAVGLGPQGIVGVLLGVTFCSGGFLGNLVGGVFADRIARGNPARYLVLPAAAAAVSIPLGIACFLVPSLAVSLVLLMGSASAGIVFYGPTFAAIHSIVRPDLRSTASALTLVGVNLLGYGCGPLLVGIAADVFAGPLAMGQGEGLRWALVLVSLVGSVAATASFRRASRLMATDVDDRSSMT